MVHSLYSGSPYSGRGEGCGNDSLKGRLSLPSAFCSTYPKGSAATPGDSRGVAVLDVLDAGGLPGPSAL